MYELNTNEGRRYVKRKPTRLDMMAYIRRKRAQGYRLCEIIYCWCPL